MRAVTRYLLLSLVLLLSACSSVEPDFVQVVEYPTGRNRVTVSSYQPRGTIEGYITLVFEGSVSAKHRTFWITRLRNAKIGWASAGQLVIIGDRLSFSGLSSRYFPYGSTKSSVDVFFCERAILDCSRLEARMSTYTVEIQEFPSPFGQ